MAPPPYRSLPPSRKPAKEDEKNLVYVGFKMAHATLPFKADKKPLRKFTFQLPITFPAETK